MNKEQYDKARSEFDQLKPEDKAVFLVEAVVSTMARGVEQFGRVVVDELDRIFKKSAPDEPSPSGEPQTNGNGAGTPQTPPL